MKVGSMFSGVAGLDLAVHAAFDAEPAWFCEIGDGGPDLRTVIADTDHGRREQRHAGERGVPVARPRDVWAQYEPAIDRWEQAFGEPAPSPTDDKGRLNQDLPRWMMGYPAGWLDGLPRTAAIKAAGNGCVPAQAELAIRMLSS